MITREVVADAAAEVERFKGALDKTMKDTEALAADLEVLVERELGVRMKFQVHTPHNDPRPQEPVADLSGLIDMEIEIDAE